MSSRSVKSPNYMPSMLLTAGNSPAELTASAYLRERAAGHVSALEYVRACLDRVEMFDGEIRAWKAFDRRRAEAKASAIDDNKVAEDARLPGVPFGVKDIFNTYDFPTSMGSPIMEAYTPGNDARVVSNMRLDGGIVLGKCITAEFAVHSPGPTRNPWALDRSPGTSSSGSAAAVASRMVPIALGSQTGGSIIRPASYCGVHGFKPSFGLIPRTAMLKTTDTLDTVGFLARSVDDLALAFESCRVRGHNYPVNEAALNDEARQRPGKTWRVGIVKGPMSRIEAPSVKAGIANLARQLAGAGCSVDEFELPEAYGHVHRLHETIYHRALAYYFKTEWGASAELFSQIMRRIIEEGLDITPDAYTAALDEQARFRQRFTADTNDFDVLVCASTADEAPIGLDAPDLPDHCLIWTFVGAPTIGLPGLVGSTGLPVGIQLVARRYEDYKLLAFARLVASLSDGTH